MLMCVGRRVSIYKILCWSLVVKGKKNHICIMFKGSSGYFVLVLFIIMLSWKLTGANTITIIIWANKQPGQGWDTEIFGNSEKNTEHLGTPRKRRLANELRGPYGSYEKRRNFLPQPISLSVFDYLCVRTTQMAHRLRNGVYRITKAHFYTNALCNVMMIWYICRFFPIPSKRDLIAFGGFCNVHLLY